MTPRARFETPREEDLGPRRLTGAAGLSISLLPNGCLHAIAHRRANGRTLISQIPGSPLDGGIGRLFLRLDGRVAEAVGPGARVAVGAAEDRFVWEGAAGAARHRVTLWLHPEENLWLWRVEVANGAAEPVACDATLVQDLGLGDPGFVTGNAAFASQYIDHHIARHPVAGPVVMSRQNLAQGGAHPWLAQGCLDGAAGFATDAAQLFGPAFRDTGRIDPALELPGERLQHEVACPAIRSRRLVLAPGAEAGWTFFGLYLPDHPGASGEADLARLARAFEAREAFAPRAVALAPARRNLAREAPLLAGAPFDAADLAARYPDRVLEERADGRLLSFFAPEGALNRHVVTRGKERMLLRRHGAILRTGQGMLIDETTMCATVWMHGVFGSLLSLGNTSFHRLFSAARDPYGITRSGGLRILVETEAGWALLGEPSVFEMGLSDCRWIYRLGADLLTVRLVASGADPAMTWRISVEGAPRRFLVHAGLALGEREFASAGRVEVDAGAGRIAFRPDPASLWGQRYPDAVYHLVAATPEAVEAIGDDALLDPEGGPGSGGFVALRTRPTRAFRFAVVGALRDPAEAERLAARHARGVPEAESLAAAAYWRHVTRETRLGGTGAGVAAANAVLPWMARDAMVHLTVPHGLEQSGGAAWGTRDVCQGPVEFLLAHEHDAVAREILRIVFAEQGAESGDWPQWFMLPPYEAIRDAHSHGDVIIWPLKALCDYIEATGDTAFLREPLAWRGEDGAVTARRDPVAAHVAKLIATVRARFIPGTHLIRYGEGDWNDSLRPVDPAMRDWMVSGWTVALLYQQFGRYAGILARAGEAAEAAALRDLAGAIRADFARYLIRGGVVAGYALFGPEGGAPELLLHPADRRTGLSYSLLPMTRGIIGGIFTPAEARRHLDLIREHLLFPDGARLMDRPVAYRGGPERVFQRAESAAFFGREIGLMYVHAHLRHGEALAALGEAEALWRALGLANPVSVADLAANAAPRQRNAFFSSSDAAFPDRYAAEADWALLRAGRVAVEGGWRIYSSGPGLYTRLLLCHALGLRRWFGERVVAPVTPPGLGPVTLDRVIDGRAERWDLSP
ncbi:cellobiose phosphorylase [Amaricoccus solimangrovi]|uniref:Cellobiose phosphorylase n=1 Tax=Amaricoccus solimangrovi TaxID=2589815 RepID=A0A501WQ25_9RHOB|nr:cellobiose phosphorylase [Amaricoccus solimangrovi]TPE51448.1 cellobiose phosphorylase [Amaricoccus solimangrovi]